MTAAGSSVQDVVARLRRIDHELPADDGAAVFNRMYLNVTEAVASGHARASVFTDPAFMEQLDVTFASLWIEAYDAYADDANDVPRAWAAPPETPGVRDDYEAVNQLLAASESEIRRSSPGRRVDRHLSRHQRRQQEARPHADGAGPGRPGSGRPTCPHDGWPTWSRR